MNARSGAHSGVTGDSTILSSNRIPQWIIMSRDRRLSIWDPTPGAHHLFVTHPSSRTFSKAQLHGG